MRTVSSLHGLRYRNKNTWPWGNMATCCFSCCKYTDCVQTRRSRCCKTANIGHVLEHPQTILRHRYDNSDHASNMLAGICGMYGVFFLKIENVPVAIHVVANSLPKVANCAEGNHSIALCLSIWLTYTTVLLSYPWTVNYSLLLQTRTQSLQHLKAAVVCVWIAMPATSPVGNTQP